MSIERDLIQQCLAGNLDAFCRLIAPHQDFLYRIALSILGTREEAEEAVQDALIRIYRGLSSFTIEVPFQAWAYRIAVRVCFNHHRSRRRRRRRETPIGREQIDRMASPEGRAPDADAERAELRRRLREIVDRLPEKLHRVVVLCYLGDLSMSEVADLLDVPEGTVKSRLYAAREKIQKEAERRGLME